MEDAIYDKEDKDFGATTPLCKHARDKVIIGGMHGSNSGQPCLIACDFYQKQCSCFHFFSVARTGCYLLTDRYMQPANMPTYFLLKMCNNYLYYQYVKIVVYREYT